MSFGTTRATRVYIGQEETNLLQGSLQKVLFFTEKPTMLEKGDTSLIVTYSLQMLMTHD